MHLAMIVKNPLGIAIDNSNVTLPVIFQSDFLSPVKLFPVRALERARVHITLSVWTRVTENVQRCN